MKKIVSIIMIALIGLSIIPKTLTNEHHTVLESTTSVYTKEEVDNLLSTIRSNITNNTNEITNIKSELTTLQNSLKDYALKTSLNTTNSNIDGLNTVVTNNISRVEALENIFEQGDATAEDIAKGKTAIVNGKKITGTLESGSGMYYKSILDIDPNTGTTTRTYSTTMELEKGTYNVVFQSIRMYWYTDEPMDISIENGTYTVIEEISNIPAYGGFKTIIAKVEMESDGSVTITGTGQRQQYNTIIVYK